LKKTNELADNIKLNYEVAKEVTAEKTNELVEKTNELADNIKTNYEVAKEVTVEKTNELAQNIRVNAELASEKSVEMANLMTNAAGNAMYKVTDAVEKSAEKVQEKAHDAKLSVKPGAVYEGRITEIQESF